MSNQPEDTPIVHGTDERDASAEPPDGDRDHDERASDEASGTSTSDLPHGTKDGELPPAP
jgi:hypothetical protein